MAESCQTLESAAMKRKAPLPDIDGAASKRTRLDEASTNTSNASNDAAKPAPIGQPEVWAQDRQALCETLPTFRSYQGSLYYTGGLVKGVLLSGDTGLSHLSSDIIIFRAPGKAGIGTDGLKHQLECHTWKDAAVKALVKTRDTHGIVFFHVSSSNGDLAIDLPHPICSLGAYWLTDIWPARLDNVVSIWCKAQKLDLGQRSWWEPEGSQLSSLLPKFVNLNEDICSTCKAVAPKLYNQSWLCLNDACEKFFKDKFGNPRELKELSYSDALLQRRKFCGDSASNSELLPRSPCVQSTVDPMWWMRDNATKGIVCQGCGQCLPRVWFRGWKCDNCEYKLFPEMTPITIGQLLGPQQKSTAENVASTIPVIETSLGEWRVSTFTLDKENSITLFRANDVINRARGGSDELFVRIQQDKKLELRRFALHNRAQREFLAAHYSQNFGMPYKYVVATESKPFSEAPDPILAVKERLAWATQQVVGEEHDAYNELLAVGYFAGNKMGFHDDGEKDLGPNVSSLSLGSDSTMSFRVKRKFHQGYTGKSFEGRNPLKDQHPIMPGSFLANERAALVSRGLQPEAYLAALEQLYTTYWDNRVAVHGAKKAKNLVQRATSPKLLLKLHLRHGDMVLMSGHRIQKYLEHEASGIGGLRFALTCREITPPTDMLDPDSYIHVPDERRSRFDGLVHHPLDN